MIFRAKEPVIALNFRHNFHRVHLKRLCVHFNKTRTREKTRISLVFFTPFSHSGALREREFYQNIHSQISAIYYHDVDNGNGEKRIFAGSIKIRALTSPL